MGLEFVGVPISVDEDAVYKEYVDSIKTADLSTAAIDDAITNGLANYTTRTYVDAQDALNADYAYVDARDNLRLKLADKDLTNRWASLDGTGKVNPLRFNAPNTQKYNRGPSAPTAYGAGLTNIITETTMFTCPVADPGYPYRLVVFGQVDAHTELDAEFSSLQVRIGNETTGEVIARGNGQLENTANQFNGDDFERADISGADALGSNWNMTYFNENGSGGTYGIKSGQATWYDNANSQRSVLCKAVSPTFKYTGTDYPRVIANIGTQIGEDWSAPNQYLRLYARANDAWTQYVYLLQDYSQTRLFYANGGAETQIGGSFSSRLVANKPFLFQAGDPVNPRRFTAAISGAVIGTWDDTTGVTALGSNNRGWGFRVRASTRNFGQTTPPNLDSIGVTDGVTNFGPVTIIPMNLQTSTVRTGATTLYVRARGTATAAQSYSTFKPRLHVMAVPA